MFFVVEHEIRIGRIMKGKSHRGDDSFICMRRTLKMDAPLAMVSDLFNLYDLL
jgi:hypothetical protein